MTMIETNSNRDMNNGSAANNGTEMKVASGRLETEIVESSDEPNIDEPVLESDSRGLTQTEFGLSDLSIDEDDLEMGEDLEGSNAAFGSTLNADFTDEDADGAFQSAEPTLSADALPDAAIEADSALLANMHSIPEKMAFKIGEAAEMVGVKQYVLRYWETEFEMLRPRKSRNGQRVYSRRDVECAMMIKKLLYNDRFSIEGARVALRQLKSTVKTVVKEEKTAQTIAKTQESAMMHMRGLLEDIRRIRQSI